MITNMGDMKEPEYERKRLMCEECATDKVHEEMKDESGSGEERRERHGSGMGWCVWRRGMRWKRTRCGDGVQCRFQIGNS